MSCITFYIPLKQGLRLVGLHELDTVLLGVVFLVVAMVIAAVGLRVVVERVPHLGAEVFAPGYKAVNGVSHTGRHGADVVLGLLRHAGHHAEFLHAVVAEACLADLCPCLLV